jgi:hypothetical protein
VVPALAVVHKEHIPTNIAPMLRDPRQPSRVGGNIKRHVYKYRGVCRQSRKGKDRWQSQISFAGTNYYLGTFDGEYYAAAMYAWGHTILYGRAATDRANEEGREGQEMLAAQEKAEAEAAAAAAAKASPDMDATMEDVDPAPAPAPAPAPPPAAPASAPAPAPAPAPPPAAPPSAPPSTPPAPAAPKQAAAAPKRVTKLVKPKGAKAIGKVSLVDIVDPALEAMPPDELMEKAIARVNSMRAAVTGGTVSGHAGKCVTPRMDGTPNKVDGCAALFGVDYEDFKFAAGRVLGPALIAHGVEANSAPYSRVMSEIKHNPSFASVMKSTGVVLGEVKMETAKAADDLGINWSLGGHLGKVRARRAPFSLLHPPTNSPQIDCVTGIGLADRELARIEFLSSLNMFTITCLADDAVCVNGRMLTVNDGPLALFSKALLSVGGRAMHFVVSSYFLSALPSSAKREAEDVIDQGSAKKAKQ